MLLISSIFLSIIQITICVNERSFDKQYDFIIVGGGTAGAVLANRLSEETRWNILLLEVGKEPFHLTDVPAFAGSFQFTEYNWQYTLEPQENMALGMTDGRINYPRGKVLGGSSILNYMMHIRGNHQDYNAWSSLGNKGWSYNEILPYFKKSEDYQVRLQDDGYHSQGGYLGVEDVSYRSLASYAFVLAMNQSGYPIVDYNGKQQYGVSHLHATTRKGRRSSSLVAFLDPVRDRKNLDIVTEAQVFKVLFSSNKAYGVEVFMQGRTRVVEATKEVILSAGALNTPQILMLSGVGPRKHLEDLGIDVLRDLPVGQKLFDHLTYLGLTFLINDASAVFNATLFSEESSFAEWIRSGTGPLASPGAVEAVSFVKTYVGTSSRHPDIVTHPDIHLDPLYPDIELIFMGLGMHTDRGTMFRHTFRISDEMYNDYWKEYEDQPAFTIYPMLLHPRSYGNVSLSSKNPFDHPKFYGNHFSDEGNVDLRTMIAGIRLIIDIVSNSPTMQKLNPRLIEGAVPGCGGYEMFSDLYWECAIRHLTATLHHQMGTCKMGPWYDSEAVVDDRLRVYGVEDLRVVDASVIPFPLSAHTNVPTYMIAEKASDMIKEDWAFLLT